MSRKAGGHAAIAQGGGPTPVFNSSVYGACLEFRRALGSPGRVWGARRGILGVLENEFLDLSEVSDHKWQEISRAPGAILGSCRKQLSDEEAEAAVRHLQKKEIRYFLYVGGNDSMDTAQKIAIAARSLGYELFVAGVPKTIDNDLPHTDHCPGYGSAARYIAQSLVDLGNDVRSLPTPVSIIEVMGRNSGWLTASTILARKNPDDAPHLVYIPEVPFHFEGFLASVDDTVRGQGWAVISVSEGLKDGSGNPLGFQAEQAPRDGFGHPAQGGVAAALAALVSKELGIRARSEKPGLCGRASSHHASAVDRAEALEVGRIAAVRTLRQETDFMVTLVREQGRDYRIDYGTVPLSAVANIESTLPAVYVEQTQNDVREEFRSYVEPLIGGPLLHYPRLT